MTIAQVLLSVWLGIVWFFTAMSFLAVLGNFYYEVVKGEGKEFENAEKLFFVSLTILTVYYNVWGSTKC